MKPKGLFIAVVLLAVLGGLWWWSNRKQEADSKKPADTSSKLLTIPEDQFLEIRFKRGAATVALRRDNGAWRMTVGRRFEAGNFPRTRAVSGTRSGLFCPRRMTMRAQIARSRSSMARNAAGWLPTGWKPMSSR